MLKDKVTKAVKTLSGTTLVHGDSHLVTSKEVTPSISVTTTYRSLPPTLDGSIPDEASVDFRKGDFVVYSRYNQDVSTRAEHILSQVNHGFAITFASGLAAAYVALTHLKPRRIAITGGYHGVHAGIELYRKQMTGNPPDVISLDDDFAEGDICWLETPVNPTGESRDIKYYADKVHAIGGKLVIDSTFGPPPLQYPFDFGADVVMHSGTKYFGGHSDLLCGILVVRSEAEWKELWNVRTFMGNMMGSLEAWLLLRSLKTLHLRVPRQSQTATKLAAWLDQVWRTPRGQTFEGVPGGVLAEVRHSSLQKTDSRGFDPASQMTGGWPATFTIMLADAEHARHFPHVLKCFVPATSLGGVESLVEHRIMSDPSSDPRLIRISVGVEEYEDLRDDFKQAIRQLTKIKSRL